MITSRVHCRIGSSEKLGRSSGIRPAVHCRIGSSEKQMITEIRADKVHCRIGSSENKPIAAARYAWVHCRIGSSESNPKAVEIAQKVHCRIGSSEMAAATSDAIWRILLSLDFAERINNTIARQVKTQCVRVDSRGTLTCLGQESVNIFDVPHEPQPDHRPCDARLLFADCD